MIDLIILGLEISFHITLITTIVILFLLAGIGLIANIRTRNIHGIFTCVILAIFGILLSRFI